MAPRRLWCVTCVMALTLVLNTVEADANNLGHDTNEGLSNEIFDASSLTATTALDANKAVGEQTKAYQPSAAGREEEFGEDDEDDELAGLGRGGGSKNLINLGSSQCSVAKQLQEA